MRLWAKYKGLAWLALIAVAAPVVVYRYALSGTVGQWRKTGQYREQIEHLRTAASRPAEQTAAISNTETVMSGALIAGLLPVIESEGLKIIHFAPCVTSDRDGIMLTTGQLSLQGGFAGMVKLLDSIESGMPHCKIVSVQFKSSRPRNKVSTKTLGCTIYIQQITANE